MDSDWDWQKDDAFVDPDEIIDYHAIWERERLEAVSPAAEIRENAISASMKTGSMLWSRCYRSSARLKRITTLSPTGNDRPLLNKSLRPVPA